MTTPAPLPPSTMERLGFIRMLHQQAVDQSRLPEPLNFTCVLAFYNAVELFLLLAGEHLGATLSERKPFTEKFYSGINQALPAGSKLDGEKSVHRLVEAKNNFKHAHLWPTSQQIQEMHDGAALFFRSNTPEIFGVTYDAIGMAALIPDIEANKLVEQASSAWQAADEAEAMALLHDAFLILLKIGPEANPTKDSPSTRGARVTGAVRKFSRDMYIWSKVRAIGFSHDDYRRFQTLTSESPEMNTLTQEDYAFCQDFVVKAARWREEDRSR
ncbi:hypothetical protein [Actinomadura terrae]|uniref:hypothetical protein n=1 Tax=Actinomadura terrae TaxID=604353 RepID=UPI001FA7EC9C|nr:hypothetical protein [Actinomadura terrae]